jgi:endoglucanase
MNGDLSNGLPRLVTSANRIINATTGVPVLLRGVNRSGLEYAGPDEQGFLSGASISRAEIEVIARGWHCNVIRVPFNQDFALRGRNNHTGEEYQQALDQVIHWASLFGAYTILDLQWLDADRIYGGERNYIAPLPNTESVELWTTLSKRYKDEPAVLYDLYSEPHDRLADDPFPLNREDGTSYPARQRSVTIVEWQPWARKLAAAIRAEDPSALIFIAGTNWGYDLRGMPMDIPNVVYSTHVYANKTESWPEAFGNLAAAAPVFVGEFGGTGTPADLDFGRRLLLYMRELQVGWAAWSWSNEPFLVAHYAVTRFGQIVQQQLMEAIGENQ